MNTAAEPDLRVPATVVAVHDEQVRVLADPQNGCQACAEGRGCGGGVLGKLVASRRRPLDVSRVGFPVQPEQRVWLVLNAQLLQTLALWTWGVPVVALVLAAAVGESLPGVLGGGLALAIFAAGLVAPRIAARHLSLRALRLEPREPESAVAAHCVSALG